MITPGISPERTTENAIGRRDSAAPLSPLVPYSTTVPSVSGSDSTVAAASASADPPFAAVPTPLPPAADPMPSPSPSATIALTLSPASSSSSTSSPSPGTTSAAAQRNRAVRATSGMSAICASNSALLAASSPCRPDQRADRMPGAAPITSTMSPESSATAGSPVRSATSRALSSAFCSNVVPVSTGSGRPSSPADTSAMSAARSPRHSSMMRRISASLPALCVATTIVAIPVPSLYVPGRCCAACASARHLASAARCAACSSLLPLAARSSSWSSSSRLNGRCSAVP